MNEFEYKELRARQRNGWINKLNGLLKILITLAFIALLFCAFLPQVSKKREKEREVENLKAQVAEQTELLARRKREENLLKNDPHYLETIARDKLDLMKEGETIIRIEPTSASGRQAKPDAGK